MENKNQKYVGIQDKKRKMTRAFPVPNIEAPVGGLAKVGAKVASKVAKPFIHGVLDYAKGVKVGDTKYLKAHIQRLYNLSSQEAKTIAEVARKNWKKK